MCNPRSRAAVLAFLAVMTAQMSGCWVQLPGAPAGMDGVSTPQDHAGEAGAACPLLDPDSLQAMGFTVRWHAEMKESHPVRLYLGNRSFNSPVASSKPFQLVYVETEEATLHAFDRQDGCYRWIHPLLGRLQVPPGEGPAAAYVVSENGLESLDPLTGRNLWSQRLPFRPVSEAVANDYYLGLSGSDGSVYAYKLRMSDDGASGGVRQLHEILWHWPVGNPLEVAPVIPPDAGSQMLGVGGDGVLVSRSLPEGSVRWRYPYQDGARSLQMGPVRSALAYDLLPMPGRGRPECALFVGSMDHHLMALDPAGGTPLGGYLATDAIESKPLVVSYIRAGVSPDWTLVREVYCLSRDGDLASLRIEDAHRARRDASGAPVMDDKKRLQWQSEGEDADDVTGGGLEASAPAGGEASTEGMSVRRPMRGIHWTFRTLWVAHDVARVVGRGRWGVFVESSDGRLKYLDESGRERWSRSLQGVQVLPTNPANPLREDGEISALFLLDASGVVWCLEEKR